MEIKSFLFAIGIFGFLLSVINCASLSSSSSVSSSPIVIKKINSANSLSSSSASPSSVSPSPSSSSGDDQPVDGSINSLNSDYLMGRPFQGDSNINSKPSDNFLGDYQPIRSSLASNFPTKLRGPSNYGSSTSSPSLTSSFSSSFSPSKLFPSLFSAASSSTTRLSSPFPVHSFALRPINRLLELFPRNDYSDDSPNGRDNFPFKVSHHRRQSSAPGPSQQQHHHHHHDKSHSDQQGNSLSSPIFYSNDLYSDLTKQGTISRVSWFNNSLRGQFPPTRKSTFRSIFDKIFG